VSQTEAALRIIGEGEKVGIRLRLFGGVAFKVLCPSANKPPLYRTNRDLDFMARRENFKKVDTLLRSLGYQPRKVFNALNAGERAIYSNNDKVDIFYDTFRMCHTFNFRDSLLPNAYTLPLTDRIITKLQVIEITEAELKDLSAAFEDFDFSKDGIDGMRIIEMCRKDWGLFATFTRSLTTINAYHPNPKVVKLKEMIENAPKSIGWKMRSKIGEKAKWYEEPESV